MSPTVGWHDVRHRCLRRSRITVNLETMLDAEQIYGMINCKCSEPFRAKPSEALNSRSAAAATSTCFSVGTRGEKRRVDTEYSRDFHVQFVSYRVQGTGYRVSVHID